MGRVPLSTCEACRVRVRAVLIAAASLAGLAVPFVTLAGPAEASPSPRQTVDERFSKVFEVRPGLTVLWEITVTGKSRWLTRGAE